MPGNPLLILDIALALVALFLLVGFVYLRLKVRPKMWSGLDKGRAETARRLDALFWIYVGLTVAYFAFVLPERVSEVPPVTLLLTTAIIVEGVGILDAVRPRIRL